ncbi:MAG: flagellar type III secretion system pore protein FliP [Flavobacteriales bacterium]|nr:flagellar type III secretion system pore protein FliP [Flavobacteriales bacterium]
MNNISSTFKIIVVIGLSLVSSQLWAEGIQLPGISVTLDDSVNSPEEIASGFQILALMTILSLAPAMLMVLTSFTRIIIVLAMLRHAFGMPNTPPSTVVISLALFLTLFTMMPVLEDIEENALQPYTSGEINSVEAAQTAIVPIRAFMIRQTREKDLALMIDMAGEERPETLEDISSIALIPAFMLSELQSAFQIGFVLFLPFLLIDLITASVLMSMGMIMVPPMTISMPIKVLMFVLIEGWVLVTQALVGSFN